ncbi:plastin-1-like [Lineus longissimus]|uniref:plastin-1-like n=1 Tax=Lineus longissimus TaxID=88925 RepID=UPI002B4E5455
MAEETLTADEQCNLRESFDTVDTDNSGYIDAFELKNILGENGYSVPSFKCRELIAEADKNADGKIDFTEFLKLFIVIKKEYAVDFTKNIKRKSGIKTHAGTSMASAEGTTHSVSKTEEVAFSNWIDKNLAHDPDCLKYLPVDEVNGPGGLYKNVKDGILLCKLINISCPDTIDERAINKGEISVFKKTENLALALNSAASIGCNIVNIGAEDLKEGKVHLVLGLLWQIIKIGLLAEINLQGNPNLAALLLDGETMDDLKALTPEQLLLRWVNYHLEKAQCNRRMNNFSSDIMDSEIYTVLLKQIAPTEKGVTDHPLSECDKLRRAELMLEEADKLDCRQFVTPKEVVNGNTKLNFAFVANLYNNHPSLDKVGEGDPQIIQETREMKTFRNWMNSTPPPDSAAWKNLCSTKNPPPKVPYIYNLMCDLCDGIRILQILDSIKPGIVHWSKVNFPPYKLGVLPKKTENCNKCVEYGKELDFSLVGIGGTNILASEETPTLSLIWQMMRAYTLVILTHLSQSNTPVTDTMIIEWAKKKLESSVSKRQFSNFKDDRLRDGLIIIDLINEVKPGSIKYDYVKTNPVKDEDKFSNAKYAISMARRAGARIYALPEDITELKSKMILTIFACLMSVDYQNNKPLTNDE